MANPSLAARIALLVKMCEPWLEANGYDLKEASGSNPGLLPIDRMSSVREALDRSMGQATAFWRRAAGSCPLAAQLVKQLLGISRPSLARELAWPLIDPSGDALHRAGAPPVASLGG